MQGINISETSEGLLLHFQGNLDQVFQFPEISSIRADKVIFDFANLKLINSLGVRNFIVFVNALSASKIIYRNCPVLMVNQFNMVKSMVNPKTKVESFYAPYFAPIAEEELELLITPEEIKNGRAPKRAHPGTGEELDFDDLEERFFYFLTLK